MLILKDAFIIRYYVPLAIQLQIKFAQLNLCVGRQTTIFFFITLIFFRCCFGDRLTQTEIYQSRNKQKKSR